MQKKTFLIIAVVVVAVFAGIFLGYHVWKSEMEKARLLELRRASWNKLAKAVDRVNKGYKGEVAVIVKDLDTGWQIEENKDMPIPSASLVKIPIMMAYFAAAEEGRIKLDDTMELKQSDKTDGSGKLKNSPAGTVCKIEDLIRLMITESDNTAANMLINKMGMDVLEGYFAKFGLRHTNLSRKMMDFKHRKNGVENYTTAQDMANALEKLYRGKFINRDVSQKCLDILADQKVNDRIPRKLPKGVVVSHKTGLENSVCHDVGIVYTDKGDFLICALAKHKHGTARPTKKFIASLSLLTYNYYEGL
ncbi:MAG: serine hydrolase [Candidatus Omnitrophota bacterium]